jgi:hypothetical protein
MSERTLDFAGKRWAVESCTIFGAYRTRYFKTERAARAFATLRAIFYLAPHLFPTFTRIRREGSPLGEC